MAQDSARLDRRALWGLLILVFLFTLLPRVIGNDHALSSDEPHIFNWTNQFYTAVMHGDLRGTLIGRINLPSGHDTLTVALPSRFRSSHLDDSPVEVVADELGLMAFDVRPAVFSSGGDIWLTLYWWALADIRHDYVLVVRLLDANGAEVIYRMGRPARSVVPTDQWRAGQEVQDPWVLALPDSQPGDTYRLELALFDGDSQEELSRFIAGEVTIP